MNHRHIEALVTGIGPVVRQHIADLVGPLAARIAYLEHRKPEQGERGPAGDKGDKGDPGDPCTVVLPQQLAADVASAVRTLHEAPPLLESNAPAAKVIRIERDENGALVPVYE